MEVDVSDKEKESFGVWGILELMGRTKIGGFVTEQNLFGTNVIRIDVPVSAEDPDKVVTHYYGSGAFYALHPVTEVVARAFARKNQPHPVGVYELQLPAPKPRPEWESEWEGYEPDDE